VNGHDENNWIGPPHNADMSTQTVTINADMTCGNGWVGILYHNYKPVFCLVDIS